MRHLYSILLIATLGLTACSKGPSKSTMKELLSSNQLYHFKDQEKIFNVDDFTVTKEEFKATDYQYEGHQEFYITEMDVVLKATADCQFQEYFSKGGVPPCSSIEEKLKKKNDRIAEIQKATKYCIGGYCMSSYPEKIKKEKIAEIEKESAIKPSEILKAGTKKTFKLAILFHKSSNEQPSKWKIEEVKDLAAK